MIAAMLAAAAVANGAAHVAKLSWMAGSWTETRAGVTVRVK